MADVRWLFGATADLTEIAAYIRQFDPGAADRYETALKNTGESLADFPNRSRPAMDGTREMATVPPYILAYRVDEQLDEVQILSIRHSRRRPPS